MERNYLDYFEGKHNVIQVITNNGCCSYLTQSVPFVKEAEEKGATKINTLETGEKHVLFLFDAENREVGRYYLGKKLQGKLPSWLANHRDYLLCFESYNPTTKKWVPCVGISEMGIIADGAVSMFEEPPPFPIIKPNKRFKYTEEARNIMRSTKVTPRKRGMTSQQAIDFYNQHLKNPDVPQKPQEPEKDPWWLKPLSLLFTAFILFGMISMCNHTLKESSDVGIETTLKSHGR